MSSGEWIQIQSALTEQISSLRREVQTGVDNLRSELRSEMGGVRGQLSQIHSNLAEGRKTMEFQKELLERERKRVDDEVVSRLDAHSDLFKKVPAVTPLPTPSPPKTDKMWRTVQNKALEAAVTAIVLGILAVCYNVWRDQTIKEAVDERLKEKNLVKDPPPRVPAAAPIGP